MRLSNIRTPDVGGSTYYMEKQLTEEDKLILSTWFDLYQDSPMSVSDILSLNPNRLTDTLLAVAGKNGKLDIGMFVRWLYATEKMGSFQYVLHSFMRPNDAIMVWFVTPTGASKKDK